MQTLPLGPSVEPQEGPRGFQDSPRALQDAQDGPKTAQEASKTPQDGPTKTPKRAPRSKQRQNPSKVFVSLAFSPLRS